MAARAKRKREKTSENVDEVEIRTALVEDIGWSASLADDGQGGRWAERTW